MTFDNFPSPQRPLEDLSPDPFIFTLSTNHFLCALNEFRFLLVYGLSGGANELFRSKRKIIRVTGSGNAEFYR